MRGKELLSRRRCPWQITSTDSTTTPRVKIYDTGPARLIKRSFEVGTVGVSSTAIAITPEWILLPSTPPTQPSTTAAEIATILTNPADVDIAAVLTQSYYSWGSGSVVEGGARRRYRRGGGKREGVSAGPLLSGEWKHYGRWREAALPEGAMAGVRGQASDHFSWGAKALRMGACGGVMTVAVIGGESAGVTGVGKSRHHWRGEHQHYRRGIAGIFGAGKPYVTGGGDSRCDRRGQALV